MFTRVRRALDNARSAADALVVQNDERRRVAPATSETATGRRGELVRLSTSESQALLRSRQVGRFAYVESVRAIDVVPVNYRVRDDGTIVFKSGPGPKLSSADRNDIVAFEVDQIDEDTHTGWSVLVVGRAHRLSSTEPPDVEDQPETWADGPRHTFVVVAPTRIEGRRLT